MSEHNPNQTDDLDGIVAEFTADSREQLAAIDNELLEIEADLEQADAERINRVFRAIHTIKGGAGFVSLNAIAELAHHLEHVLNRMRNGDLAASSAVLDQLLRGFEILQRMFDDVATSNDVDVSEIVGALSAITEDGEVARPAQPEASVVDAENAWVSEVDPYALEQLQESGHALFRLRLDLLPYQRGEEGQLMGLVRRILNAGEIVFGSTTFEPSVADVDINSLDLDLVVASQQMADDLIRHLQVPPESLSKLAYPGSDPTPSRSDDHPSESSAVTAEPPIDAQTLTPQAPPAITKPSDGNPKDGRKAPPADPTVRVHVTILDRLMTLAGELVLGRNQLLRGVSTWDRRAIETVSSRVDQVTSELQEAIMHARMQPVGSVFNKFPRVVRDLAKKLGKQAVLNVEGKDVELDRTIIEGINDPLTHLIRNSIDHGIELPEARRAAGKSEGGTVSLRAFHENGKVNIEIRDDGGGIDTERLKCKVVEKGLMSAADVDRLGTREILQLIFLPGMSTAEAVSDVSGRGVGMDVVLTNIERLGGAVEIDTVAGAGTSILIKLPLTLAILTALLVECGGQRFAIPQVNIFELARIRREDLKERVREVEGRKILVLRGSLFPLVHLSQVLDLDREAPEVPSDAALNVIVVDAGHLRYGIVVDSLIDSEEIVVKPLGQDMRGCQELAGATILGDGQIAFILDVAGITAAQTLTTGDDSDVLGGAKGESFANEEQASLLLFTNAEDERFAVEMTSVVRIDRVRCDQIKKLGKGYVADQGGRTLPIIRLEDAITANPAPELPHYYLLIFNIRNTEFALIVPHILDMREVALSTGTEVLKESGVVGSFVRDGVTTRILDILAITNKVYPQLIEVSATAETDVDGTAPLRILLAEDSTFFRKHLFECLDGAGYDVVACEDGQIAWDRLTTDPAGFDLVVTDIEMPNMSGLDLTRRIRADESWQHLHVIAVTSLAGEADVAAGKSAGVDDYQVKLNRQALLESVSQAAEAAKNERLVPA